MLKRHKIVFVVVEILGSVHSKYSERFKPNLSSVYVTLWIGLVATAKTFSDVNS